MNLGAPPELPVVLLLLPGDKSRMRIDRNYDHTNNLSSSKKWMNPGSPQELPVVLLLLPGDKSRMRIDQNYDHTNHLSSSKK
jgi:hypothetical protein